MIEFRELASAEIGEAVALGEACGLTRPWNDPVANAEQALTGPTSIIFGAFAGAHLIGTGRCRSNTNPSPLGGAIALTGKRQAMRFCHSASPPERCSL